MYRVIKELGLILAVALGILAPAFASARTPVEPGFCYELYQPVCAARQVQCIRAPCYPVYETYSNSCFMEQAGATLIHEGACTAAETGPVKPSATSTSPVATTTATTTHPWPTDHQPFWFRFFHRLFGWLR
jgi:hypothetical protein